MSPEWWVWWQDKTNKLDIGIKFPMLLLYITHGYYHLYVESNGMFFNSIVHIDHLSVVHVICKLNAKWKKQKNSHTKISFGLLIDLKQRFFSIVLFYIFIHLMTSIYLYVYLFFIKNIHPMDVLVTWFIHSKIENSVVLK